MSESNNMTVFGIRKKRLAVYIVIFAMLLVNIIGAVWLLAANGGGREKGEETYNELAAGIHTGPLTVDFDRLSEQNPDVRAWIISEGTGIDYPIVQGEDNEYYRRHLFSRKSNPFGCLFIDAAQPADFSAKNTVIHGGAQLDTIYKYARQDYYELLPSVNISTPDGNYTVLLFAGFSTDDITEAVRTEFADDAEFAGYLAWLEENSLFAGSVSVAPGDRIVTLCASNGKAGFVLAGKIA